MKEVIWHGRGGQGAFTAAKLLGAAYTLGNDEHFALSFPTFGPERRGAPVRAFTKLSESPIGDRSQVRSADYVVVLDETLYSDTVMSQVKEGGRLIINTASPKESFGQVNVTSFDATALALEVIGRPITNTIMLGVLAGIDDDIGLGDIEAAVCKYMPAAIREANVEALRRAYAAVSEQTG